MAHLPWKVKLDKDHPWWQHQCPGIPRDKDEGLRTLKVDNGSTICRSCGYHRKDVDEYGFVPAERKSE